MTRPRSGRAPERSGNSGRRSSRRESSSGGNQAVMFGGLAAAAAVVVVIVVFAMSGKGASTPPETPAPKATARSSTPPPAAPESVAAPDLSGGVARAGKTPDRPAPTIDAADLTSAEQHYRAGVGKWNEAQVARNASKHEEMQAALRAAYDELAQQRKVLEKYTDWLEEADFGDWAIPSEYGALQTKLDEYDRTFQRVKKNMPIR